MTSKNDSKQAFIANFELFEKNLNGEAGHSLHGLRVPAIETFARLGIPTNRDEDWRYTSLSPITSTTYRPALLLGDIEVTREGLSSAAFNDDTCHRLVFVNGHYVEALSNLLPLPEGVTATSLALALKKDPDLVEGYLAGYDELEVDVFTALNTAFIRDGAFIQIPNGVAVDTPIHLLYVSTVADEPIVSHPRNLVVAGESSSVSIIEEYACVSEDRYFTNPVTEIIAGERSVVNHYKIQHESEEASHIGALFTRQSRSSVVNLVSVTFGSALVRNNTGTTLRGERAHCTMDGLYLASDAHLIDNHTRIDHAVPNCTSHELYKGIMADKGRGVFNGRIIVRRDAQKTDSKQSNQNLLLSDEALIDTMPQLEIYADDVKCTHGATIGQLDEGQIFYLRARAIGQAEARVILTYAFAEEIVERIKIESLRTYLNTMLVRRLYRNEPVHEVLEQYAHD